MANSERLFSPSVARNRDVIRDVFLEHMPLSGDCLEIASGSGEHCVHIAEKTPALSWHPGDPDPVARSSQRAWIKHSELENIHDPHSIDVTKTHWEGTIKTTQLNSVISINMIHIAPFAAAQGLFEGAGRALEEQGKLFLYGPFSRNGEHISPSNETFDASLKSRDPAWGVRDLENDIIALAEQNGFSLTIVKPMPANNLTVIFQK